MDQPLIDVDEAWFRKVGTRDAEGAATAWHRWLASSARPRSAGARHRQALQLATGLSRAAVSFYFSRTNAYQLAEGTRARLDDLSVDLGYRRREAAQRAMAPSPRKAIWIAVLTELEHVPSPRFHIELLMECSRELTDKGFLCTLHECRAESMQAEVARIARYVRPDGVMFLRLTPSDETCEVLREAAIPTVLVHAHKKAYAPPVLTNVVPKLQPMATGLRLWAQTLPDSQEPIVVVTMTPESEESIRYERLQRVREGLADSAVVEFLVDDYSFRHASKVLDAYPHARGYVCLSDEIAVGIKHLLEAKGEKTWNRIVGYDDSRLAALEGLSSFGQHIGNTAKQAVEALTLWFRQSQQTQRAWPAFHPTEIEVGWTPRNLIHHKSRGAQQGGMPTAASGRRRAATR